MIRYLVGDATAPEGDGLRVIAHVCNDCGAWGAGFVVAVSRRWPLPERRYREASRLATGLRLGDVQIVRVEPSVVVANMVAQSGFPSPPRPCALDYDALRRCLVEVALWAEEHDASVHLPRIGCGIAGGSWDRVEPIVALCASRVPVTVYDLPTSHRSAL